jgi:hypothetical protein
LIVPLKADSNRMDRIDRIKAKAESRRRKEECRNDE